jgi:hypothetical protein
MGRTITQWEDRASTLLGAPKPAPASESMQDHVLAAVRKFSADLPRITYADYPGDGVTFDLALPAAWMNGFSRVQEVEYPQGERPPVRLDLQEVSPYPPDSAPTAIRLRDTTPAVGKTARVFYSLPWPVPDENPATDKISDLDFEPVCHLAAAYAALELASDAAGHTRNSLSGADLVGEQTEQGRWLAAYDRHLKTYLAHVGADEEGGGAPASGIIDWDATASFLQTGRRFLFRGRR